MAQTILTEAAPPEKEALYGALGVYPDKNSKQPRRQFGQTLRMLGWMSLLSCKTTLPLVLCNLA